MDFKIKILQDPLPYDKISELYGTTYVEKYFESGANDWKNPKYTEWYFGAYHHDKRFFYSAWKGDQLIATMFGTPTKIIIDNEVEISAISLGLTATLPEFQRQGVQKALIQRLIDDAKNAEIDIVYGYPEKGYGGNDLLKFFNFKRYTKNQQHYIKVMGDYGRKILRDYRGLNVVLAKLLVLYAGIPENQLEGGEFRDGKDSDVEALVPILNSYQKRVQISQNWTAAHLREEIEGASRLNKLIGPPSGFYWKVWERDARVLASFFIRTEMIHFKHGSAPIALLSETIFHEDVTESEKLGVVATLCRWVRDNHPKVFTIQTTQPQYELKTYKDLKFIDDTSTYEFLVLPLTEQGAAAINRNTSYKDIFMPYHR